MANKRTRLAFRPGSYFPPVRFYQRETLQQVLDLLREVADKDGRLPEDPLDILGGGHKQFTLPDGKEFKVSCRNLVCTIYPILRGMGYIDCYEDRGFVCSIQSRAASKISLEAYYGLYCTSYLRAQIELDEKELRNRRAELERLEAGIYPT